MELKMTQNRNKLIELFIGNIANAILHKILEKAISDEGLLNYYKKEEITSRNVAVIYRGKINPKDSSLPEMDIDYIKEKVKKKVYAELMIRISKGYREINLDLIDQYLEELLNETKVI